MNLILRPINALDMTDNKTWMCLICGWIYDDKTDEITVYYGAADTSIAIAVTTKQDLLAYLRHCPISDENECN